MCVFILMHTISLRLIIYQPDLVTEIQSKALSCMSGSIVMEYMHFQYIICIWAIIAPMTQRNSYMQPNSEVIILLQILD